MQILTLREALKLYPGLILRDGAKYWEQSQLESTLSGHEPAALDRLVFCNLEGIWGMTIEGQKGTQLYATVRCPFCHDLIYWSDYTEALEGLAHSFCDAKDWH
ncbi:MAG: hypothetical protein ACLFUU_13055 [Desulfobacteraceae bacterium]